MIPVMPASAAWYVTGRFYVLLDRKTVQDLGSFLHQEGLAGSFFTDPKHPSEATARLTLGSAPSPQAMRLYPVGPHVPPVCPSSGDSRGTRRDGAGDQSDVKSRR